MKLNGGQLDEGTSLLKKNTQLDRTNNWLSVVVRPVKGAPASWQGYSR